MRPTKRKDKITTSDRDCPTLSPVQRYRKEASWCEKEPQPLRAIELAIPARSDQKAAARHRIIQSFRDEIDELRRPSPDKSADWGSYFALSEEKRVKIDTLDLGLEFLGEKQERGHTYPPNCDLGPETTPQEVKLAAISYSLERGTRCLLALVAKGDPKALQIAARHNLRLAKVVSDATPKRARHLRPVARESLNWVVLKSHCLHYDDTGKPPAKADAQILDNLQVGRNHPIKGRRWNPHRDRLAEILTEVVEAIQGRRFDWAILFQPMSTPWAKSAETLPPLSPNPQTVEGWWKVVKLYLKWRWPSDQEFNTACAGVRVAPSKERGSATRAEHLRGKLKEKLKGMAGCYAGGRQHGSKPQQAPAKKRHHIKGEEPSPDPSEEPDFLKGVLARAKALGHDY